MPKFATAVRQKNIASPIQTLKSRVSTHEGGLGFERDSKSELFLLAITNMVSEETFYENAPDRDDRFAELIRAVAQEGEWTWLAELATFLRNHAQMRSAAIVLACEYAKAWTELHTGDAEAGASPREVVASVCARADEPAEIVAYWAMRFGAVDEPSGRTRPRLPMAVKKGLADAALRLYTEASALRYNGAGRSVRMADVLELTHPRPQAEWQDQLFRYLLDTRHGHFEGMVRYPLLSTIGKRREIDAIPVEDRRFAMTPELIGEAGLSWESLSGWLQGVMDAEAWEAVIPSMGYMALIRNLRNFQDAGVSREVLQGIATRIANPAEVARSRQLPIRFFNAWLAATGQITLMGDGAFGRHARGHDQARVNSIFAEPLEHALNLSLVNIPQLAGRTVILVDVSGSMVSPLSTNSRANRWEYAALFGMALAARCDEAELYAYATDHVRLGLPKSIFEGIRGMSSIVGGGTNTWETMRQTCGKNAPDRVVILTDEQAHDSATNIKCPIYTFNLAGYSPAHIASGPKSFTVGGLTDAGFSLMSILEKGLSARWPWENEAAA